MTATDELRRMLDERGVEYEVEREGKLSEAVLWDGPIGTKHSAFVSNENPDKATGEILYATLFLPPEQAITATLGRGTCRMGMLDTGNEAAYEHYEYIMHCEECHHEFGYVLYNEDGDTWMDERPRYCHNCGRKVVEQ
jgi:hypothetical protein